MVEGPAVRGGVGDRVVDLVEIESGDAVGGDVQGARGDEPDHAHVRGARIHSLPAHGHRVAHDPGVGQGEVRAAEHAEPRPSARPARTRARSWPPHVPPSWVPEAAGGRAPFDRTVGGCGHRDTVGVFVRAELDRAPRPNRSASRSRTARLRPGAATWPTPMASAMATALLPRLAVAPLTSKVSQASNRPASSPPWGMVFTPNADRRAGSANAGSG